MKKRVVSNLYIAIHRTSYIEGIALNYDKTLVTKYLSSPMALSVRNLQYVGNLHTKYQYILGIFLGRSLGNFFFLETTIFRYMYIGMCVCMYIFLNLIMSIFPTL